MARVNKKKLRRQRPISEIYQVLLDQLDHLVAACAEFDAGRERQAATQMSNILRQLFKSGGTLRSVFTQLHLNGLVFRDTTVYGEMALMNLTVMPDMSLAVDESNLPIGKWIPSFDNGYNEDSNAKIKVPKWWNKKVILEPETKEFFSRERLVCSLAEQDGGTHTDPELEEAYYQISRKASFQYGQSIVHIDENGNEKVVEDRRRGLSLVYAIIRQISHEVLIEYQTIITHAKVLNNL